MRRILSALMKEGVVSIVLLVILCLLVWFGGAYLGMDEKNRLGIIAALLGMWALMFVAQKIRAVKGAMRIEKQLKAQSGSQLEGASADKKAEIEALRKKFDDSLDALKKSKGGKSALFTLPWYVIIGPPGSGKTTALQESGLNFPASQGNAKVKGIGGTRNCDWWFTDEGILLDTAGRYTTVAEDQEEWLAFLGMIKQGRKQKPINGAIVAVGLDELLRAGQSELDQIAKDVRNRLDELSARLQAVFPVYVMFTKCDLLPGFVEFFEDYTKEERSQVWGMTFPYSVPDRQYADIFDEESRRLLEALAPRRVRLLASERPAAKKQNIYLFPRQYELALPRMKEFIASLFHATAFQESAVLRGIYFSSGTQKGAPIDQLMARMGAALGVEAAAGADDRVEKKSFFINHLFTQLMFPDKALARSTSAVLRKRRMARAAVQFGSVLGLALAAYILISSFILNRELVIQAEEASQALSESAEAATDLERLRGLEAMRAQLVPLEKNEREHPPMQMRVGMYQGNRLFEAGVKPYMERLHKDFVVPATRRVETRLQHLKAEAISDRSSDVYMQLQDLWRVYRMIGGDLTPEAAHVASVLGQDRLWTGLIGGGSAAEISTLADEQLKFYAQLLPRAVQEDATEAERAWLAKIDKSLVEQIGGILSRGLWEELTYNEIIYFVSQNLPPLGLATMLEGDENRSLLEVRMIDGAEDPQRLLNALTQSAWDNEVKPTIDRKAQELRARLAEYGMNTTAEEKAEALRTLHKRRHALEWRRYLASVYPVGRGFARLTDARDGLRQLSGDRSPYRTLFRRAWENRALNMGPGERLGEISETETKGLEDSLKALDELRVVLDKFVSETQIDNRYLNHRDNPAPLEGLRDAINTAVRKIRDAFPRESEGAAGADVMLRVVEAVISCLRREAVLQLEGLWNSDVADVWPQVFAGKYPFDATKFSDKNADNDVSLAQLAAVFNPVNGKLWMADGRIRAVQALKFNDRPLFDFRADYEDTIRNATVIREAMFDTPLSEKIKVRFSVTLSHRDLLYTSSFQAGQDAQTKQPTILRWNESRGQTREFVWEPQEINQIARGARLEARWGSRGEFGEPIDLLTQEWGLLKLLQRGDIMGPAPNSDRKKYYCSYSFTTADRASQFFLDIYVVAAKSDNPFAQDIFTKLKVVKGFAQ